MQKCNEEALEETKRLLPAETGEDETIHTEETLFKVHYALTKSSLTEEAANSAIISMQNTGILFRERV